MVNLADLRQFLDKQEEAGLSAYATRSVAAIRRRYEERIAEGHRQNFAVDADRILHSRAYTRYIDKTQVFYLISHEQISHRVLHVQLLSKIARTIGKFLRLNEDLLEAIALGHDIGHPPFGHRHVKFPEQFLSLIFVNFHDGYKLNISRTALGAKIAILPKYRRFRAINCHSNQQPNKQLPKNFNEKQYREQSRETAVWQSKWLLIKEQFITKEKIEIADAEIEKIAEEESAKLNIDKERLVNFYKSSENALERLKYNRLIDILKQNVKITEVVTDDYSKFAVQQ